MKICKYELDVREEQVINLPEGAKILCVQTQCDRPKLWVLCNENASTEPRLIKIYATGTPISEGNPGTYIGTFQLYEGSLVFHIFESDKVELA